MKKMHRLLVLLTVSALISALLCGCGAGKSNVADRAVGTYAMKTANGTDEMEESATAADAGANGQETVKSNRKIIEYIGLSIETKNFDKLIEKINSTVKKSGGYVESSEIGGNSYYGNGNRSATLQVRIPTDNKDDFSAFLSENGNVTNRTVTTDDVTEQYIDVESRLTALKLEKETLEGLLKKSANVSDMLTVYDKLADIISQIEGYQSRLQKYDNLIEYTTFTLEISEVERMTSVEKTSIFSKTWTNLKRNFADVGRGLLNFLSFLIAALPYWIVLAVIAVIAVLIAKRAKKRHQKKAEQEKQKTITF